MRFWVHGVVQGMNTRPTTDRVKESVFNIIQMHIRDAVVLDLFAGTGSVGYALSPYKTIISNDIEYYAYIINQAILNGCNFSELEEASFWAVVEQKYRKNTICIRTLQRRSPNERTCRVSISCNSRE